MSVQFPTQHTYTDFVADLVIDSMCLEQLSFSVSNTPRYLNSAPLTNKVSSILKAEEGCYGQDLLEMINYLHIEALKFIAFWDWEHNDWSAVTLRILSLKFQKIIILPKCLKIYSKNSDG